RTFRVDRIDGDVEAGEEESFSRPPDFEIRAAFPRDPKELPGSVDVGADRAVVRFDAAEAPLALLQLGEESVIRRHDDGGLDVSVPCTNVVAFTHWVLGFMERAEVLAPPALRRYVVDWVEAMFAGGDHG
ncbi:MAG: WYL domain-containing protein, partial [Actinomycetota bacterium]